MCDFVRVPHQAAFALAWISGGHDIMDNELATLVGITRVLSRSRQHDSAVNCFVTFIPKFLCGISAALTLAARTGRQHPGMPEADIQWFINAVPAFGVAFLYTLPAV